MTAPNISGVHQQNAVFAAELSGITPILLIEPLAQTLGAFEGDGAVLAYTYLDVIKMAGHACPTTAAAFECCRAALARLYPNTIPVRGQIAVTVCGEPDDGVYGVIAQVFSLITGAAAETGFKGLATFFRRKDLLTYDPAHASDTGMRFQFKRVDTGRGVSCTVDHDHFPSRTASEQHRLGTLMKQVLWEAASDAETAEFRKTWRQGVLAIFRTAQQNPPWLTIEEGT